MNNTNINEMFESEEFGEMWFNNFIRSEAEENDFGNDNIFNHLEKELSSNPEEKGTNENDDEMGFDGGFTVDDILQGLDEETLSTLEKILQDKQEVNNNLGNEECLGYYDEFVETMEIETTTIPETRVTSVEENYDGYNKLMYQGQEYYVKKKNTSFPVCVMNDRLVQVGLICENDINHIIFM